MPSKLSSPSKDPWLDMASAVPKRFEKEEPIRELRPPVCGDGLRKLLLPKPHVRSPSRKKAPSGKAASDKDSLLVGGSVFSAGGGAKNRGLRLTSAKKQSNIVEGRIARSPSSESVSSQSVGVPKRNRKILSEFLTSNANGRDGEGQEVAPYYVLQFDPSSSSESSSPINKSDEETTSFSETGKDVGKNDSEANSDEHGVSGTSAHSASVAQRMPNRPSRKSAKPTTWSSSLPSVTEENTEEGSLQSSSSHSQPRNSPTHSEILKMMKSLVHQQQKSIEDMENENKRFREELAEYKKILSEAKMGRSNQEDTIGFLTAEKNTSESATLWLREEMKALKAEIARMKDDTTGKNSYLNQYNHGSHGNHSYRAVHRLNPKMEKDPDLIQFAEVKKAIYGSILEVDSLLKSRSEESFADSSVFNDDRRDDVTAASSSFSLNGFDRQDEDNQRLLTGSRASSTESSISLDHALRLNSCHNTRSEIEVEYSSAAAARSKEEVNLFKSRLEAIQKKREERKIRESDFGSRSGRVQFD